jgi:hypothetical protein
MEGKIGWIEDELIDVMVDNPYGGKMMFVGKNDFCFHKINPNQPAIQKWIFDRVEIDEDMVVAILNSLSVSSYIASNPVDYRKRIVKRIIQANPIKIKNEEESLV